MSAKILTYGGKYVTFGEKLVTSSPQPEPEFRPFITTWDTTKGDWGEPDDPEDKTVMLWLGNGDWDAPAYNYAFTIKWGDGHEEFIDGNEDPRLEDTGWGLKLEYEYAEPGVYDIEISGIFGGLWMAWNDVGTGVGKLIDIVQWGDIIWDDCEVAFAGCTNLGNISATDIPNFSEVETMVYMFNMCWSFDGNISGWDVSNVTDMYYMFSEAYVFNGNISGWNISNVTNTGGMFKYAELFNQNIGGWDTSNVTDMRSMFEYAKAFDQDIGGWDTSSVSGATNMSSMFAGAEAFNQDLSGWCVSNISIVPHNFDLGATSWVLPRPVWGTCPE